MRFCHPMEMPPQECALTWVQGTGLAHSNRQGWDPHSRVLVWRHWGCHRPTTQAGWCEWEGSQRPINQCGGEEGAESFQSRSLIPS